ncbi:alpha-ketoglutarate-dependent dioxygenase AlkB [Actibacterium sp. 188UL27-1]|uniref:alpha-ketoglutarate-dependent dioxygenase AlkB family protein n=1 Tax=Actibacterium sp. 188UL27-1 TaxID=2786961 RepID=UPI001957406A|nr:alpha-ketoglutarate-dependent dioxygenase AlkB [Actibacterium sp. 188UL27-1]MBM7067034.1 alpha-ketoglutarate-dependent dioxygenase AlkB [Actibacterium sp. 188UL27-1]
MTVSNAPVTLRGVLIYPSLISIEDQAAILDDLSKVLKAAPLFQPVTPSGKPMSVRMSAAGQYGWITDRQGYRYAPTHPDGQLWPAIPGRILRIWDQVAGVDRQPECCLINFYGAEARMGLHQDRDEADFTMPVVSISLGDEGLFRVGNTTRGGKTESLWLRSGDVAVMGGAARLVYHGVDRIRAGTSTLMPKGGRVNLTLRVVT